MSEQDKTKLELTRMEAELKRDTNKWKVRRRLALTSFFLTIVISIYYLTSPFFLAVDQAIMLRDFNSVILTLIGTYITVVLAYIGAATYADNK